MVRVATAEGYDFAGDAIITSFCFIYLPLRGSGRHKFRSLGGDIRWSRQHWQCSLRPKSWRRGSVSFVELCAICWATSFHKQKNAIIVYGWDTVSNLPQSAESVKDAHAAFTLIQFQLDLRLFLNHSSMLSQSQNGWILIFSSFCR